MNGGLVAKAVVSAFGAGLTTTITALQDGRIDGYEWAGIAGAVLASGGLVWLVTNAPTGWRRYLKAIVALLTVAAGAVGTALLDGQGITTNEALTILLALATSYTVSNTPNSIVSDGEVLSDPAPQGPPEDHFA